MHTKTYPAHGLYQNRVDDRCTERLLKLFMTDDNRQQTPANKTIPGTGTTAGGPVKTDCLFQRASPRLGNQVQLPVSLPDSVNLTTSY